MPSASIFYKVIINEGTSSALPAILAITENDHETITLEIVCKKSTSTHRATFSELPQSSLLPEPPKEFLKSQLTGSSSDSPFQTKYERNEQGILIHISQRLSSGLVRVVWETTLKADDDTTVYDFTEQLFQLYQEKQTSHDKLKTAFSQLDKARADWKDTAEKLEHVWENEKSELLDNFLTLYKKQQELTAKAQERSKQLEEELLEKKKQELDETAKIKTYKKDKFVADMLNEEPDDFDTEIYSKELVAKLAGSDLNKEPGQDRPPTRVVPKKVRNKATGAIEYFDEDEALADLIQTRDSSNGTDASGGRNAKRPASRKKVEPPKKVRKSKKDDSSTDSAGNYSESELDSSVLAHLAAIKNMED